MRTILIIVILLGGATHASGFETSLLARAGSCESNCAYSVQQGSQLFVVARSLDGSILSMETVNLGDGARSQSGVEPQPMTACGGGTCTEQTTHIYVTPTEVIYVTIILYYVDGELVDVDVIEKRIPRSHQPY